MKYNNMNDFLEKVKCFHEVFKAPVLETPQIPSKERCNLRVTLIQEELDEIFDSALTTIPLGQKK
jgi:predicted HAD superfamily Cof-like phosphohydrolase